MDCESMTLFAHIWQIVCVRLKDYLSAYVCYLRVFSQVAGVYLCLLTMYGRMDGLI